MHCSSKYFDCIFKRQVVEMPPIHPVFVEHRSHSKECTVGMSIKLDSRLVLMPPIQYGRNIENHFPDGFKNAVLVSDRYDSLTLSIINMPLLTIMDPRELSEM